MRYTLPFVGVVLAHSLLLPVPARAQDQSFTGPRIELRAGWDQVRFDLTDIGQIGRRRTDGLAYGVVLGFDIERPGGLILGGEASFDQSEAGLALFDPRRDIGLSGRIGTRVSDQAMIFGKLGYTNLRARTLTTLGDGTDRRDVRTLDGIRIGAGTEVGLARNLFLKAEYDYSNYEDGVSRNQLLTGLGFRF